MAIAFVSAAKGVGTGTTVATDTTLNVTAGNGLIVVVSSQSRAAQTINGISSAANPTGWTACAAVADGNGNFSQVWYKPNASAGATETFTATWSATISDSQISVVQASGLSITVSILAAQNTGTAVSLSTVTSGTLTAAQEMLIVAGYSTTNTPTWTPDNSATEVLDSQQQYAAGGSGSHYRIVTAGTYTAGATASAGFGFAAIAAAAFVGPNGPSIDGQPANFSGRAGDVATFSVSATTSGGALSYQWKRNGATISGATSATYSLTTADADQRALITADVTDSNGTRTSSAALVTLLYGTVLARRRRRRRLGTFDWFRAGSGGPGTRGNASRWFSRQILGVPASGGGGGVTDPATGRFAVRAVAAAAKAAASGAIGSQGLRAATIAGKAVTFGATASVGARGAIVASKSAGSAPAGRVGAEAAAGASKAATAVAFGRLGAEGAATGAAAGAIITSAAGRMGGRAAGTGSKAATAAEQPRAAARADSVAAKAAGAVAVGAAGTRAIVVAAKAEAAAMVGRLGASGAVVAVASGVVVTSASGAVGGRASSLASKAAVAGEHQRNAVRGDVAAVKAVASADHGALAVRAVGLVAKAVSSPAGGTAAPRGSAIGTPGAALIVTSAVGRGGLRADVAGAPGPANPSSTPDNGGFAFRQPRQKARQSVPAAHRHVVTSAVGGLRCSGAAVSAKSRVVAAGASLALRAPTVASKSAVMRAHATTRPSAPAFAQKAVDHLAHNSGRSLFARTDTRRTGVDKLEAQLAHYKAQAEYWLIVSRRNAARK
jgi:trimeric autotransporter adhesin